MSNISVARFLALTAALAFTGAGSLAVSPAAAEDKPAPHFIFLNPEPLDPATSLPPPAAAGSADEAYEISEVRAYIASRTPEQIAKAAQDDKTESALFLADVLPGLNLDKLPATRRLFDDIRHDEKQEAKIYKTYFHRTRPYLADPALKVCVAPDPDDAQRSYPSGHSVMGSPGPGRATPCGLARGLRSEAHGRRRHHPLARP